MTATLPESALDPVVRKIGEVAGLLGPGGSTIRDEFLQRPLDELARAVRDRQAELIELLGMLLGETDAEVLGLPGGGTEDRWIPVRDAAGAETGLFIVAGCRAPHLHLGLGWRLEAREGDATVRVWAHVPLLRTNGSAGGTALALGSADAALRIATEVTLRNGFGVDGLRFRGVRGQVAVSGTTQPPDVRLVLLGLEMGGGPPADRSLADLASLPADAWIETAIALFTAQLEAAGIGTDASRIVALVLPLIGVRGADGIPRLAWEALPTRGHAVFDDWFAALTAAPAAMQAWLGKWQALLGAGAGGAVPVAVAGSGTRADPWRAGVTLPGTGIVIGPSLAVTTTASGARRLYLGLDVRSAPIALASGPTAPRLELTAAAEIVEIPVADPGTVRALPSLRVLLRMAGAGGPLARHTFPGGDPLAPLGTLQVGAFEAGLVLDEAGTPVPHVALRDVQCARGSWPVLDLSAADAVLDGLGSVANNLIQQQLEQGLGLGDASTHAGKRVAALLGLLPPSAGGAPSPWPVPLATDAGRLAQFLGDPLAGVARYHGACLTSNVGGAPAWRFLLAELGELLRDAGSPPVPIGGDGTPGAPWRLTLARTDAGDMLVRAHLTLDGGRPQLRLAAALEPRALTVDDAAITLAIAADLLHLDLPDPATSDRAHGTWLPALHGALRLASADGLETPSLGGLRLGAAGVRLALDWTPPGGVAWHVRVDEPVATWEGARPGTIALPPLELGATGLPSWTLTAPDLGGALGGVSRDAVAELTRFLLGHLALEHGGPAGFGLAALLGLLPSDPDLTLPSLRGASFDLSLPADFPVLTPSDWGAFASDPWPTVRAHLGALLAEPRFSQPLLRWLSLAAQGLAPVRSTTGELLTFDETGDGPSVDGADEPPATTDNAGTATDAPLAFPSLEALPVAVRGRGTFTDPYRLGLRAPAARGLDALLWLDPDGPPAGSAVEVALQALAPALRDLTRLDGVPLATLLDVLGAIGRVDEGVAAALEGITPGALGDALGRLEAFLASSDGVVLTASQQPTDASWTRPPVLEAAHTAPLATPAVVGAITTQLATWDAGQDLPVLLLTAPFARNDGWQPLATALGAPLTPFTYRLAGTSPSAVSVRSITGAPRLTAAELAVYDDATGLTPAQRVIPVDGAAGSQAQAEQVVRLVERLRELHPGKRVLIVAHSASGLAARAALARGGMAAAVRGVITVGTPHVGTPLPWLADPTAGEAVAFLRRVPALVPAASALGPAIEALWQFLQGRDLAGAPLPWPLHAFAFGGAQALPAGVDGLALATRLPPSPLRSAVAQGLAAHADALRAALAARPAVTHVGVGLALAPPVTASDPTLRVAVAARIDVAQLRVADGASARPLPRLVLSARVSRQDGWLVGAPDAAVRVRAMHLGCTISADAVTPDVRLFDVAVDGLAQPLATLHALAGGGVRPDDMLAPALDAVFDALTRGAGANAEVRALARLLASLDLMQRRGGTDDEDDADGYALNADGWLALMADARAYATRILAEVLASAPERTRLLARLRALFGWSATDLTRLLVEDAADPPAWRALRALLRAAALLDDSDRGSVPRIAEWLALVASPAAFLRARIAPLVHDAARRAALFGELRVILGVSDVAQPVVHVPLGGGVHLRVEALGTVTLEIAAPDALPLGGALSLSGTITLDLRNGSAEASLRLQPVGITTAVVWRATLGAAPSASTWVIALDFSDGARAAPFAALPLYPVPVDFAARLGALLPRLTVSTIASALLDTLVLPRLPELAAPLTFLGLARPVPTGRLRVDHLARLVADPRGWLLSPAALGTAAGTLDATRLAGLVRALATSFRLADAAGTIALPLGLVLRTSTAGPPQLVLDMTAPLALGGGATLDLDLALGWTPAAALGAGGSAVLRAPIPGASAWSPLEVHVSVTDGTVRVALGAAGALLPLLPFSGFGAAALGAAAERLLPTLLDAMLQALDADPAVTAFVTRLRGAAATLEVDSVARLDALVADPVAWLRRRCSSANATASVTALRDLIDQPALFHVDPPGTLRFQPVGSPVAVTLGRNGVIGLGVRLTDLDLGPLSLSGTLRVGLPDGGPLVPLVETEIALRVRDGVIAPAGVSIVPSLAFTRSAAGAVSLDIHPIGNVPGSPDFVLRVLPTLHFGADDGGNLDDALLSFARRVLVPVVLETFLDSDEITAWLRTSLVTPARPALEPGALLVQAGLLRADAAGTGFDLVPLDDLADPMRLVEGLIGAGLSAASAAFAPGTPLVGFGLPGVPTPGLYAHSETRDGVTRHGVRVVLPELRLSEDPEVILRLGGRSDWIAAAGGPAGAEAGLSVLAIRDNGAGSTPRFALDPVLSLAGVGVHVSGKYDEPLLDVSGFELGGLEALLFLRVGGLVGGSGPTVQVGLYADLADVAIPLGASDSNPVASSLMAGGGAGGDAQPVNPRFSVRAAYVNRLWLEIGGEARNEVWFPIQRTFGPVTVQQVGVRWIGGPLSRLAVLLDGGVALAGLSVGVDDLSLTVPLARISRLSEWELGLRGLAVAYDGGGVKIGGGLLQAETANPRDVRYDGLVLVEVGGKSFVAFGSYGTVDGDPSLFVFLVVGIPIGGPPYFFVTGLAGGFGYNRGLVVPPIEGLPRFPLVEAMSNTAAITADPMRFLQGLGPSFPMERGSYWFAAGIKFTSFTLVNSQALLYVLLNRGLEIGLLGMSTAQLPPAPAPALVSVELALKARFSTVEGLVSVEARLTDNSWLLARACRLTGGFAFFLWFGGAHAGDFVISLGGYHPRWTKPAHYPDVPRLGFHWRAGGGVTIKGEAYFALTPREMMAGGLLEVSYDSGDIAAWFRAWADAYIMWRPFWFEFSGGVSIGVRVDTWLGTVRVEVGAEFVVWGPEIGGKATVKLWIVSFTVRFGAGYNKPQPILSWGEFRRTLLPPENEKLFSGGVERGLLSGSPADGPWLVLPEFVLRTETFIAASEIAFGAGVAPTVRVAGATPVDVKPMAVSNVRSVHRVSVIRRRDGAVMTARFQAREELGGNVPRALWDTDAGRPAVTVIAGRTGARLVATFDEARLGSSGAIPWARLFETGRRHPLPFAIELGARPGVRDFAIDARLLDRFADRTRDLLDATGVVLGDRLWRARREATFAALESSGVRVAPRARGDDLAPRGTFRLGRRSSPPLVRSLYEGLSAEAVPVAPREPAPVAPPVEPPVRRIVPTLQAVTRLRVEPMHAAGAAVRTTVDRARLGAKARRADMTALRQPPFAGAAVRTVAAAQSPRESGVATTGRTVVRSLRATRRDIALLDVLDKAAFGGGARPRTDTLAAASSGGGVPVDPGSTLRWSLPTRDVGGEPPVLAIAGAAVRVTALGRSGVPLLDVELAGTVRLPLPPGTATLAVTGLGRSGRPRVEPAPGAITLHEATSPVPVVGWQAHTPLVIVGEQTLLARGATVRLAAPLPAHVPPGTLVAAEAVALQRGVETILPATVRAIAIVLDEGAEEASGPLDETFAASAVGAVLTDEPLVVAAGARTVLVYDVVAADSGAETITVPVAFSEAWTLAGVLGFSADARTWAPLLAHGQLDTLVENGPLSPLGSATVQFLTPP